MTIKINEIELAQEIKKVNGELSKLKEQDGQQSLRNKGLENRLEQLQNEKLLLSNSLNNLKAALINVEKLF